MKVKLAALRARGRPLFGVDPAVCSHEKEADRRKIIERPVLEPMVEPGELKAVDRISGLRAVVDRAIEACPRHMLPRANDQNLTAPLVLADAISKGVVVADGPVQEDVIPAADVEARDRDIGVDGRG